MFERKVGTGQASERGGESQDTLLLSELKSAWEWRKRLGLFDSTEVLRVFHGPGDSRGALRRFAVDRFGDHYWITQWEENKAGPAPRESSGTPGGAPGSAGQRGSSGVSGLNSILNFLESQGAKSAVGLNRPKQGLPESPVVFFGTPPEGRFQVREGNLKFWIEFQESRHPGLFLDHQPLRKWLLGHTAGMKVLNTFAYTGIISVAAAVGGASRVTTLDLSKNTLSWAEENLKLNEISADRTQTLAGDYFEWLPKLKRKGEHFDCVILDPPSFSRGKKGNFSTAKDLVKLHTLALDILSPGGILITSINSANVTWKKFESDLLMASREAKKALSILSRIDLPETFPTSLNDESSRYLKGWILRAG